MWSLRSAIAATAAPIAARSERVSGLFAARASPIACGTRARISGNQCFTQAAYILHFNLNAGTAVACRETAGQEGDPQPTERGLCGRHMGDISLSTLWLNLIVISGTWGSSFVLVKLITESMHPFTFAASRGFIAMAALLAWLALRSRMPTNHPGPPRSPTRNNLRHMLVLGTTNGWLANVLTAIAVSRVDSAVVAMLQASVPLMVVLLAHFAFVEEPFQLRQFTGIITGMTGILLIVGPVAVFGSHGSLLGILAMLLAALSYACGTVYGRFVASTNPVGLACGQQACGAIVAAIISLLFEPRGDWNQPAAAWLLLTIVGVICSAVPTVLYLRLLARAPSVPAALVAYLQPVWATLLGWAILAERVRPIALLGTGIVVAGIVAATRKLPS
jgi:drug/metabolite transporter (DMT)-like permease